MITAATVYYLLNLIGFIVDIRHVCVFLAPLFSGFTAVAAHLLAKEVTGRAEAGLISALFMAIVPSYMSRSVAGSYDNECVAIFGIVFSFYTFAVSLRKGTVLSGCIAALAYFYLVCCWGGYVFVLNAVSAYVAALLVLGMYEGKQHISFCCFYLIGSLFGLNIPFVRLQVVHSAEHLASHSMFICTNCYMLMKFVRQYTTINMRRGIATMFAAAVVTVGLGAALLMLTGTFKWSGRSMTLLDPRYANKYIPIIASVSEHQPTTWSSYCLDLNILMTFTPIGFFVCFFTRTHSTLLIGIYGLLSVYFTAVMIRLLLVWCPAACVLAGVGLSFILSRVIHSLQSVSFSDKLNEFYINQLINQDLKNNINTHTHTHTHPHQQTGIVVQS
eukprot:GHVR01136668.1.p1 GENE.GHVR01136668.1~~GHVR01136668.1.p1  ORF type:complete len:387 (-),score=74.27 GHVR01136668.1:800-1960(-)